MYHQLYELCVEPLIVVHELAAGARVEPAAVSRERLQAALDRLAEDGGRRGLSNADLAEARYALVAFIDERLLESDWAGRGEWMKQPLQLVNYHENAAGEQFFVRLRALLEAGGRTGALLAYHLCLSAGFRGAYGRRGDERALMKFARATERALGQVLPSEPAVPPVPAACRVSVARPLLHRSWWVSAVCAAAFVATLAALVEREREGCSHELVGLASATGVAR